MTTRIVTVYPDLLGTYGDAGNGIILEQRLKRRGLGVEHQCVNSHEPLPEADLYVLGGGEDGPQGLAAERLGNDASFMRRVSDGATVFAVCAGYQILTKSFVVMDGSSRQGLGLFDAETIRSNHPRAVGEMVVVADPVLGIGAVTLSGFENHGSLTQLHAGATALGQVTLGVGHAGHVQVLDGDEVELIGQGVRDSVELERPGLGDGAVQSSPASLHLGPVLGALLAPGQSTVHLGQAFQLLLQHPGVGDVAVLVGESGDGPGQGGQVSDAGVDPDGGGRTGLAWCTRTHHWPIQASNQVSGLVTDQHRRLPTSADMRDRDLLDGDGAVGHLLGQAPSGLGGVDPGQVGPTALHVSIRGARPA